MSDPAPPVSAPRWYCVRTATKQEARAAEQLRRLDGVDVFCPRIRFQRATRRGKVWFVEALFPGYLFARFDAVVSQKLVQYTNGVRGLVVFGGRPAPAPDEEIAALRAQLAGTDETKTITVGIRAGERIQVAAGPFMGLSALVTQVLPARDRVRILLDMLGRAVEAEIAQRDISPEKPPDPRAAAAGR